MNLATLAALQRFGDNNSRSFAGIMTALNAMSGVEEDPNYLDPKQAGPQTKNPSPNQFKGKGPFGAAKARATNTSLALDQISRERDFEAFKRELEAKDKATLGFNESLFKQKHEQEDILDSDTGAYQGQVLGNLPSDELANVIPPAQTFNSPLEQHRFLEAAYGPNKSVTDMAHEGSPLVKQGKVGKAYNEQFFRGSDGGVFSPSTNKGVMPSQYLSEPVVEKVQTGTTMDTNEQSPTYGQSIPLYTEKVTHRQRFQEGFNYNINPSALPKVDANIANSLSGRAGVRLEPTQPFMGEEGYMGTNNNPSNTARSFGTTSKSPPKAKVSSEVPDYVGEQAETKRKLGELFNPGSQKTSKSKTEVPKVESKPKEESKPGEYNMEAERAKTAAIRKTVGGGLKKAGSSALEVLMTLMQALEGAKGDIGGVIDEENKKRKGMK